ncbi:hypothetical protein ACQP1S_21440 [Micromonospora matsumotoense]|uniref:hypothetical protein n=1 Tax=Micromonospora matsumotoense TaxID=121616 RepID=UPI003D8E4943
MYEIRTFEALCDQLKCKGVDLQHSLTTDPTRGAATRGAEIFGEDIWVAVMLSGELDGDDDLDDGVAIRRWTTVVPYPDELGWPREALALNADDTLDEDNEDDDLAPLS